MAELIPWARGRPFDTMIETCIVLKVAAEDGGRTVFYGQGQAGRPRVTLS